jgi:hypothetical protein
LTFFADIEFLGQPDKGSFKRGIKVKVGVQMGVQIAIEDFETQHSCGFQGIFQ